MFKHDSTLKTWHGITLHCNKREQDPKVREHENFCSLNLFFLNADMKKKYRLQASGPMMVMYP